MPWCSYSSCSGTCAQVLVHVLSMCYHAGVDNQNCKVTYAFDTSEDDRKALLRCRHQPDIMVEHVLLTTTKSGNPRSGPRQLGFPCLWRFPGICPSQGKNLNAYATYISSLRQVRECVFLRSIAKTILTKNTRGIVLPGAGVWLGSEVLARLCWIVGATDRAFDPWKPPSDPQYSEDMLVVAAVLMRLICQDYTLFVSQCFPDGWHALGDWRSGSCDLERAFYK